MVLFKSMRISKVFVAFSFLFLLYAHAIAKPVNGAANFDGVTKQLYDSSCGAAALSTLLRGVSFRKEISEEDVLNTKRDIPLDSIGKTGFTMQDLLEAASAFGHKAEWRKISRDDLNKIREPVIILIGLNSHTPHYVVLKGVIDGVAYLADPMRGNIRISYAELSSESLNEKYQQWYVMAVNRYRDICSSSDNQSLYISENIDVRDSSHIYYNRLDLAGLAIMPKSGDFILEYNIGIAKIRNNESRWSGEMISTSHMLTVRYGVLKNSEIIAGINYIDAVNGINIDGVRYVDSFCNYSALLSGSQKVRFLDSSGKDGGGIFGAGFSYSFNDEDIDIDTSILAYYSNNFDQIIFGGYLSKNIKDNHKAGKEYTASLISAYNRTVGASNVINMSAGVEFEKINTYSIVKNYLVSIGLSRMISKNFQISPALTYRFGDVSGVEFRLASLLW